LSGRTEDADDRSEASQRGADSRNGQELIRSVHWVVPPTVKGLVDVEAIAGLRAAGVV